ncbi:MAG: helix-turn-helix domain-containing protein [Micromonosporaceae bacterium]
MEAPGWRELAALVDPVRRGLYDYVRRQGRAVTREEAAQARNISRNLAAFHLDKLVDAGLLCARYETPPGQPRGRGRTPKVYEPVGEGVAITVPERRYDLAGEILADAVASGACTAAGIADAVRREAFNHGRRLGQQWSVRPRPDDAADHLGGEPDIEFATARAALADLGFEPCPAPPDRLTLRNCPFHALVTRQPELICGLNESFVAGLLAGLDTRTLSARLAPRPGWCCVEVHAAVTRFTAGSREDPGDLGG